MPCEAELVVKDYWHACLADTFDERYVILPILLARNSGLDTVV